jgi:hypothetical protein
MPLRGPRFAGDPILEDCLLGKHRMLAPEQGLPVMRVQAALSELGHPVGADGIFGTETGNAVSAYKVEKGLSPSDPVVGPGTSKALDDDLFFEPPELDPLFEEFSPAVVAHRLDPFIGQELARMAGGALGSWRRMIGRYVLSTLGSDRLVGIAARSRRNDLKKHFLELAAAQQGGVEAGKWFDELAKAEEPFSGLTTPFSRPDGSLAAFITVADDLILGRDAIKLESGEKVTLTLAGVLGHELTHLRNLETEDELLRIPDTDTDTYADTALAQARSATGTATSAVMQKFVAEMCARHVHWIVLEETSSIPGTPASLAPGSLAGAFLLYFAQPSSKIDVNKYMAGINSQGEVVRFRQLDLWLRRCQAFSFSDDAAENARTQALLGDSAAICANLAVEPSKEFPAEDGLFPLPKDFH